MAYGEMINQVINENHQRSGMFAQAALSGYEPQFLNNIITDELLPISSVETVYVSHDLESVHVWTIVDDPAEYVYDQIYDAERGIIQRFPTVRFDFVVVPRKGRDTQSVITLTCPGWTKQATIPPGLNH